MLETALSRFWRGVREPWELLGRMRHHRALWRRYWRTVLVQAALTLVAGLAVFWVAKEGAEAWRDAFGPDDLEESSAPAVAGSGSTAPARAPDAKSPAASPGSQTSPRTEDTSASPPGGAREPTETRQRPAGTPPSRPGARGKSAPVPPAAPPPAGDPQHAPPPPTPPPGEAPRATAPSTGGESVEEREEDEEETRDGEEGGGMAAALEEKIKALQDSPPEQRGKRTAELVAAAVEKAKQEATRAQRRAEERKAKGKGDEAKDELAEEREGVSEKLTELTIAAEALAHDTKSSGEVRRARRRLERELSEVEKEARALEKRGAPPLTEQDRARLERARTALYTAHRHERGLAGRIGAVLALLAAIYASLGIAQTGILALSRDFHDQLSRDLSLLVNVAPEDPPMRPKVRLDIPWLRRKTKRRVRFFIGFLPGAILINIVARLVPPHRMVTTVLTALWAAYWWMVMTAGQSARAWTPPETTQMPWYLRGWFA